MKRGYTKVDNVTKQVLYRCAIEEGLANIKEIAKLLNVNYECAKLACKQGKGGRVWVDSSNMAFKK